MPERQFIPRDWELNRNSQVLNHLAMLAGFVRTAFVDRVQFPAVDRLLSYCDGCIADGYVNNPDTFHTRLNDAAVVLNGGRSEFPVITSQIRLV